VEVRALPGEGMIAMGAIHTSARGTKRTKAGVVILAMAASTAVLAGPVSAAPAKVSAELSQTSFTAAEASQVKLTYKFSATSHHFGYLLSRKRAGKWVKVRSVTTKGTFKGSHATSVKRLFGTKPIIAGRYRVKVSADANTVALKFAVTTPGTSTVVPRPGTWKSTSASGSGGQVSVTDISFTVSEDGRTLTDFTFHYTYSGVSLPPFTQPCSGSDITYALAGAPTTIADGQFSGPTGTTGEWFQSNRVVGGSGSWTGTFDSPTRAHGSATFSWGFIGIGCMRMTGSIGPFPWTAVQE